MDIDNYSVEEILNTLNLEDGKPRSCCMCILVLLKMVSFGHQWLPMVTTGQLFRYCGQRCGP